MKRFVVSDPHSFYDELMRALEEAGFFKETEPCEVVFCGDPLDRGPDARRVIEFMLQLKREGRLVYVLGNHEDLLVQCIYEVMRKGISGVASEYRRNRTWDTMLQIADMTKQEGEEYSMEVVRRVRGSQFYNELLPFAVDYYETPSYVFTHGWIPCKMDGWGEDTQYTYDPNWREADHFEWQRARWLNGIDLACKHKILVPDKTVICGHISTAYAHRRYGNRLGDDAAMLDFSPFYSDGIIAIDGSVKDSGKVNCIVIDD